MNHTPYYHTKPTIEGFGLTRTSSLFVVGVGTRTPSVDVGTKVQCGLAEIL